MSSGFKAVVYNENSDKEAEYAGPLVNVLLPGRL